MFAELIHMTLFALKDNSMVKGDFHYLYEVTIAK